MCLTCVGCKVLATMHTDDYGDPGSLEDSRTQSHRLCLQGIQPYEGLIVSDDFNLAGIYWILSVDLALRIQNLIICSPCPQGTCSADLFSPVNWIGVSVFCFQSRLKLITSLMSYNLLTTPSSWALDFICLFFNIVITSSHCNDLFIDKLSSLPFPFLFLERKGL